MTVFVTPSYHVRTTVFLDDFFFWTVLSPFYECICCVFFLRCRLLFPMICIYKYQGLRGGGGTPILEGGSELPPSISHWVPFYAQLNLIDPPYCAEKNQFASITFNVRDNLTKSWSNFSTKSVIFPFAIILYQMFS